ncbi:MAG TPA: hypothetical protein QGH10_20470 [Armatimonadota bacterium]|nr:hypothetical protein [Armatimonadota bacterium]
MKWLSTSLAGAVLHATVASGDVSLGQFTVSTDHGNIVSGTRGGEAVLARSLDQYALQTDTLSRSDESHDEVLSHHSADGGLVLECRNRDLGIRVTKEYHLADDGALAKTIRAHPLPSRGELHIYSVVSLDPDFRESALYYTPRQSWPPGPPERQLWGVRPAKAFTHDVISGSMWDNQFAVAFQPSGGGLGHYRHAVNGRHVMPSTITGRFYGSDPHALTYTGDGWRFRALHMLEGDHDPVSATMHYYLTPADFIDVWRHFRTQPEQQAWERLPVQPWCSEVKIGTFWFVDPPYTDDQAAEIHAATKLVGDTCIPVGFGWGLDGDYDTDDLFINQFPTVAFTPSWIKRSVAGYQSNPQVRVGMYIQGMLIERISKAFSRHPEWALTDVNGDPMFSDFRDHPAGALYYVNPLEPGWIEHYLARIGAVCDVYDPGWIYCDGGLTLETTDYRLRRALLPDAWYHLYQRQYELVHASGQDRAVLLNAQNLPYADMYWLETSAFRPDTHWRETIEFCFDTCILRTPERAMIALGWSKATEECYLALCAAFGYTPCTFGPISWVSEKGWRVVDVADAMRRGEMILSSEITSPVWWREDTPVVCFPMRVGDLLVVPVLNFGTEAEVSVTVDVKASGMDVGDQVWLVHPFAKGQDKDLGTRPPGDKASFALPVEPGYAGLRLLVLGDHRLL